jgi:hypothetical protein
MAFVFPEKRVAFRLIFIKKSGGYPRYKLFLPREISAKLWS